jgi:hypothetical protein
MRFFIFTLLLSFLSFGSLKAQEQVWNISSDEFNSLGDITQTTVIDGLTIYATDAKKVTVQDNEKEIDGLVFTSRLKLNGSGSIEAGAVYRVVSFEVTGYTTISIAAISGNGDEIRDLAVVAGDEELQVLSLAGDAISMNVVEYVGDATSIKIYSKDSGINLYYIKAVTEEAEEEPVVSDDALAILDPKVLDTTTLPSGMSVVEMDGTSYLQIVVDGYNSVIDVPEFTLGTDQQLMCNFKFSIGDTSAAVPFTLDQIKGIVQIMDTINKVDNPWGEGLVPSSTALAQDPVTGSFAALSGSISSDMSLVHQVQFYGQDKVNWQATKGDTIWVSKIRAINVDPDAIFDPKAYDPDNLPAGMEIVDMDGTSYLQIVVDGYNSVIEVPEFTIGTDQQMICDFKFSIGDTSAAVPFTLDQIKGIVQIMDTINKVDNPWGEGLVPSSTAIAQDPVNGSFVELSGAISTDMKLVHQVQFYGQDKVNWQATTGDTIWVSKIKAITVDPIDPNIVLDPATFDGTLETGWEIVDLDGTKYFKVAIDGWNTWINVPEYDFPAGKNAFKASVKYEIGTSGVAIEDISTFLKFSDASWAEIGSGKSAATTEFSDYVVTLAANEGNTAGVFQVAGQTISEGTALSGDFLYIGKVMAVTTAPISFVIDDSKHKKSEDGFIIKGSWFTNNGIYDSDWNGGALHAEFQDSSAINDVIGDNIWAYTINLVADENTWEWGFVDMAENWMVTGDNPQFGVADWTPQTLTYTIGGTSIDEVSAELSVYPNPVENVLNIKGLNVQLVEVFNMTGSKVSVNKLSNNQIDVSNLSNGSYILRATADNGNPYVQDTMQQLELELPCVMNSIKTRLQFLMEYTTAYVLEFLDRQQEKL